MVSKHDTDSRSDDEESSDSFALGRRSLLRALGATGAASALADPVGAGDTTEASTTTTNEEVPPGTEALLGYVEANYGDQLNEEQLADVKGDIAANLRAAAAVEEVSLDYTTGPAFTFTAYRADDRYEQRPRDGAADRRSDGEGE